MDNLTATQAAALKATRANSFKTASELGATGATMSSLARLGLVDTHYPITRGKVGTSTPSYRITGRGVIARRKN